MSYNVDAYNVSRPVGPDDAGQLTNELRAIKSILVRYRDGVEKNFNDLNALLKSEGLPIELGGTGARDLAGARAALGIKDPALGLGIAGFDAFGPGYHTWQVPEDLKGTGRKFIVVLSGGGGGAYTSTSDRGRWSMGGHAGLAVGLFLTNEVFHTMNIGKGGAVSTDGEDSTILGMTANKGLRGVDNISGANGEAAGGILNLAGGGSSGGKGSRNNRPEATKGVDGYCVIIW